MSNKITDKKNVSSVSLLISIKAKTLSNLGFHNYIFKIIYLCLPVIPALDTWSLEKPQWPTGIVPRLTTCTTVLFCMDDCGVCCF